MADKASIMKEIDAAIEAQDESRIDAGLQALSALEGPGIRAEDAQLFAARIQKLHKERIIMKKPFKSMRIAIVAGALLLTGLTAYAADALNIFSFQQGDRFVTIRSSEGMTEQQARQLAEENENQAPPEGAVSQAETQEFSFDSREEAEQTMDMQLPLPAALPPMSLDSATGSAYGGEEWQTKTVWLTYGDEAGRLFGLTVSRQIVQPGESVTSYSSSDIDAGSLGAYKSASGVEYTTLSESNEDGSLTAQIATAMVGEYEYSLIFMGFSEAEQHSIIDSVDLSVYK